MELDQEKMNDRVKCECNKKISYKDNYRCRICKVYYCDECSLEHYGLYEKDGVIKYKNILKSIFWIIKGKVLGKYN